MNEVYTDYNVSSATRVIVTGFSLSLLFFSACRWRRKLGLLFGMLSVAWAALFPFYWADWFSGARFVREYGEWRYVFGFVAAILPLLFVLIGCFKRPKRSN